MGEITFQDFCQKLVDKKIINRYNVKDGFIKVEWVISGCTGSGYSGDLESTPIGPEPEKDLEALDLILEQFVPNIGYLQSKKLERAVISIDTENYRGYYGDEEVKCYKKVVLLDLYNYINNNIGF